MDVLSTTPTIHVSIKKVCHKTRAPNNYPSSPLFPIKQRTLITRNSGDGSTSAPTPTEEAIDSSKVSDSLISALNVQRALRGIAITDVDHYGRLGLQPQCSNEQVMDAYKTKVEELMNQTIEEDKLKKQIELLKQSYSVLSSKVDRRLYDWSLARNGKTNADKYVWPFEVDVLPASTETPPPREPEDEGPTKLVGYGILAWFILGVTLSIALNL